jgi:hypothetical protein
VCDWVSGVAFAEGLHRAVPLPAPPPADQAGGVLGVDLGIVNLAVAKV